MNTFNSRGQYATDEIILDYSIDTSAQYETAATASGTNAKYGLTAAAYEQLVEDCEESVEMCDHIHQFLNTNEDIQRYLF